MSSIYCRKKSAPVEALVIETRDDLVDAWWRTLRAIDPGLFLDPMLKQGELSFWIRDRRRVFVKIGDVLLIESDDTRTIPKEEFEAQYEPVLNAATPGGGEDPPTWSEISEEIDGENDEVVLAYWLGRWEKRFKPPAGFAEFRDLANAADERVTELLCENELLARAEPKPAPFHHREQPCPHGLRDLDSEGRCRLCGTPA